MIGSRLVRGTALIRASRNGFRKVVVPRRSFSRKPRGDEAGPFDFFGPLFNSTFVSNPGLRHILERIPEFASAAHEGCMWSPRIDVYEHKEALVIEAELPGVDKSDVKIKVTEGFLELSGERKTETTDQNEEKYFKHMERSQGSFMRRVKLPKGINANNIKANFDKGILRITVPFPDKTYEGHDIKIE